MNNRNTAQANEILLSPAKKRRTAPQDSTTHMQLKLTSNRNNQQNIPVFWLINNTNLVAFVFMELFSAKEFAILSLVSKKSKETVSNSCNKNIEFKHSTNAQQKAYKVQQPGSHMTWAPQRRKALKQITHNNFAETRRELFPKR